MNNHQTMLAAIKATCGQANLLAIPRILVDFTGNLENALLLSQIIYWSERTANPAGWFYKSHADWTAEICLSEYQVRKAVKRLVELGLIETALRRAPTGSPTCHYRMDWAVFSASFLKFLQTIKDKNCENQAAESGQTLNTEITTKTTNREKERGATAPTPPPLQEKLKLSTQTQTQTPNSNSNPQLKPPTQTPNKHPAIETYRRLTGRYPLLAVEPLIHQARIETETQLRFWEQVICRYIGCGWNRQNICAMLEFYQRGELPGSRPRSKKSGGDNDHQTFNPTPGNSLTPHQRRLFGIDKNNNPGHNSGSP